MNKKEDISKIIHKINNLLASSSLSIEMVLREFSGKLNDEQKKYLRSALSDWKKIKALIKKTS